jgi:Protein of unknown function (DUF2917)
MPPVPLSQEITMSHTPLTLSCRQAIGSWRLHPGHAMALRPRRASLLRIYCGRVWVTQGGPYTVVGRESGDHFLLPGDTLRVPAGARLVMEPLADAGDERPVHFDWSEVIPQRRSERFAQDVLAPAHELRAAVVQSGVALARLVRGLIGWGGARLASGG